MTHTLTVTHTPTATLTETQVCAPGYLFGWTLDGYQPYNAFLTEAFELSDTAIVTALQCQLPYGCQVRVGIYSDAGSAPGTLIVKSNITSVGIGWKRVDLPDTLLPPGKYYLSAQSVGDYVFTLLGTGHSLLRQTSINVNDWPGNWPGGEAVLADSDLCLYAEICLPPGIPTYTHTPTVTHTATIPLTPTETILCASAYGFGRTSDGNTVNGGFMSENWTMPDPGTVTSLHGQFYNGGQARVGIYTDIGSAPGSLIVQSNVEPVSGGWSRVDIPDTYLPAGSYYLTAQEVGSYLMSQSGTGRSMLRNAFIDVNAWPATYIGGWSAVSGNDLCIWAEYCLPGGATYTPTVTTTPTSTHTPSATASPSHTASGTSTPTNTDTSTLTFTETPTSTRSFTPSFTDTRTPSATASPSHTASSSMTSTPSLTVTGTFTETETSSPSATPSETGTDTQTFTSTWSPTLTLTFTMTLTPTETLACGSPQLFGNLQEGNDYYASTPMFLSSPYDLAEGVTVLALRAEIYAAGSGKAGIWSDVAGGPGNLIVISSAKTTTAGWNRFEIADTFLPPGRYWLAFDSSNSQYRTGSGTMVTHSTLGTKAWPSVYPGPGGTSVTLTGSEACVRAEYCPPPPSPTPTVTNTPTTSLTATPTATLACDPPELFGNLLDGDSYYASTAMFLSSPYDLAEGVTVMALRAQVYAAGSGKAGIWSDGGGGPGNLIVISSAKATVPGWNRFDVTDTFLPAGRYWLAFDSNNSQYLSGATGTMVTHSTLGTGAWPAAYPGPGGTSVTLTGPEACVRAEYCPPPPSPTPTFTSTRTFTPTFTRTNSKTLTWTLTPTVTNTATRTPCTYDGSFGETAMSYGVGGTCGIRAVRCQILQNALVHDIRVYIGSVSSQFYVGIYDDAAGEPGNLLSVSPLQNGGSNSWQMIDIPDTSLTPGYYWLAIGRAGSTGFWTSGQSVNYDIQARESTACTSDLPAVFPASTTVVTTMAMEALYCTTAPAVSPTTTATPTATTVSTQVTACGFYGPTAYDYAMSVGSSANTYAQRQGLPGGYAHSLSIYMNAANPAMQVAVYADNVGLPTDILTYSTSQAVTAGWNTLTLTEPAVYLGSGDYWLAWSSPNASVMYDENVYLSFRDRFGASMPDPFGTSSLNYGGQFAMQVEMCP